MSPTFLVSFLRVKFQNRYRKSEICIVRHISCKPCLGVWQAMGVGWRLPTWSSGTFLGTTSIRHVSLLRRDFLCENNLAAPLFLRIVLERSIGLSLTQRNLSKQLCGKLKSDISQVSSRSVLPNTLTLGILFIFLLERMSYTMGRRRIMADIWGEIGGRPTKAWTLEMPCDRMFVKDQLCRV